MSLKFSWKTKEKEPNLCRVTFWATMICSACKLNLWEIQWAFLKINYLRNNRHMQEKWTNFRPICEKKLIGFRQHTIKLRKRQGQATSIKLIHWNVESRSWREKEAKWRKSWESILECTDVWRSTSKSLIKKQCSRRRLLHQFLKFWIKQLTQPFTYSDLIFEHSLFFNDLPSLYNKWDL